MRFKSKAQLDVLDEVLEHEISSYTYQLLERGTRPDVIEEFVLNRFGEEAIDIVSAILNGELDEQDSGLFVR